MWFGGTECFHIVVLPSFQSISIITYQDVVNKVLLTHRHAQFAFPVICQWIVGTDIVTWSPSNICPLTLSRKSPPTPALVHTHHHSNHPSGPPGSSFLHSLPPECSSQATVLLITSLSYNPSVASHGWFQCSLTCSWKLQSQNNNNTSYWKLWQVPQRKETSKHQLIQYFTILQMHPPQKVFRLFPFSSPVHLLQQGLADFYSEGQKVKVHRLRRPWELSCNFLTLL